MRTMFGPKREEVAGEWKYCIMRNPVVFNLYLIKGQMGESCNMWDGKKKLIQNLE
jgi:hypothetical protein